MNTKPNSQKDVIESDQFVNEAFASYLKEHKRPSIIIIGNDTKHNDPKDQRKKKDVQK